MASRMTYFHGVITHISPRDGNWGFVQYDGSDFFFHFSELVGQNTAFVGDQVKFFLGQREAQHDTLQRLCAKEIQIGKFHDGIDIRAGEEMFVRGSEIKCEESRHVEFKSLNRSRVVVERIQEMANRYMNAFFNTEGGKIYFGVEDNRYISGLTLTSKQRDDIRLRIDRLMFNFTEQVPPRMYKLEFIRVLDHRSHQPIPDCYVVVITCQQKEKAVTFFQNTKREVWMRLDGSCVKMTATQIRDLTEQALKVQNVDMKQLIADEVQKLLKLQLDDKQRDVETPRGPEDTKNTEIELTDLDPALIKRAVEDFGFRRSSVIGHLYELSKARLLTDELHANLDMLLEKLAAEQNEEEISLPSNGYSSDNSEEQKCNLCSKLQEENNKLQKSADELRVECENLKTENSQLQEHNQSLASNSTPDREAADRKYRATLDSLSSRNHEQEKSLHMINRQIEKQYQVNEDLRTQLKKEKESHRRIQSVRDKQEGMCIKMEERMNELQKDNIHLKELGPEILDQLENLGQLKEVGFEVDVFKHVLILKQFKGDLQRAIEFMVQ